LLDGEHGFHLQADTYRILTDEGLALGLGGVRFCAFPTLPKGGSRSARFETDEKAAMNSRYPIEAAMIERVAPADKHGDDDDALAQDLRGYFGEVMADLRAPVVSGSSHAEPTSVAASVIDLLFSRQFSYLGRSRARAYEESIRSTIVRAVQNQAPIPFFFDIGGGYHATIHPGQEDFTFGVGLGELFVMTQIARFRQTVAQVYAPGLRFSLVIDNLCALLVNDIAPARTLDYCTRLRRLIKELFLEDAVSVLVESEHFSAADVEQAALAERPVELAPMTPKRHRNVERFLGRPCTEKEALEREARYHAIVNASESLLNRLIDGIHMTQRASSTTMCFRPFPGGDSRIQSGQVVMTRNASSNLHPILLTSANADRHTCATFQFADLLPREVDHVVFVTPVATPEPLETRLKV
jgi:hypothetical protein